MSIVEEFEEVGGFRCGETDGGGVIFVGVLIAGKLSVVDFDLSLGCSQFESENLSKWDMLCPTMLQKSGSSSHCFGS